jgi:glycerophosphoryl diester phosphodiesterase
VITIAHRAANDPDRLRDATAVRVDYAEADVWLYRGRLEVRHEKTLGPLPFQWDRWYIRRRPGNPLRLDDVLAAVTDTRLLLDLKGSALDLAERVAALLERASASHRVAFTGMWGHLDRMEGLLPDAPRFYTVGGRWQLRLLRRRLQRGPVRCASIDSRILTKEVVDGLRTSGVETIITWSVETEAAARQLLDWGVDGVTSDNLALLATVKEGLGG